jgi:hypothetical protein
MITITELTEDIEVGDQLLIEGQFSPYDKSMKIQLLSIRQIKKKEGRTWEVILKAAGNVFFNYDMYKGGRSWAKDIKVVNKTKK